MDEELRRIRVWASHGTMKQFATEVTAKISKLGGYQTDLEGDTLTIYHYVKSGGVLGIGARKVKETVLKVIRQGDDVVIPEDSVNADFVERFSGLLKQH